MSETKQVRIRCLISNVDDMEFDCPCEWNVKQLRMFVHLNHASHLINQYSPDRIGLAYLGRFLQDKEFLDDILVKSNLIFVSILTQKLQQDEKESENLREKLLKEQVSFTGLRLSNTNIQDLELISYYPLTHQNIYSQQQLQMVKENIQKLISQKKREEQQDVDANNIQHDDNFHYNILKTIGKFIFIYYMFSKYFQNGYYWIFLIALLTYVRICYLDACKKNKPDQNGQIIINIQRVPYDRKQNKLMIEVCFYIMSAFEFVYCFIQSMYPNWYIELYYEEHEMIQLIHQLIYEREYDSNKQYVRKLLQDLVEQVISNQISNNNQQSSDNHQQISQDKSTNLISDFDDNLKDQSQENN